MIQLSKRECNEEILIIGGDLNAHVGEERTNPHAANLDYENLTDKEGSS